MESPNSTLTPSIDKENELRIFATHLSVSYREGGGGGGEPWDIHQLQSNAPIFFYPF